jgi:hypothetical protein
MSTMPLAPIPRSMRLYDTGSGEPLTEDAMQPNWETYPPSAATNRGVTIFEPGPVPSVSWIPAGLKPGLARTLLSLHALVDEQEEDDEYGPAHPTDFAYRSANYLVRRAASLLTFFPAGSACTDGVAGIRLTWRDQTREIRLVLSPTPHGRSYLYRQQGEQYEITEDITEDRLAALLRWLDSE